MRNSKRCKNQRGFFSGFIKNTAPKKRQRGARGRPQACTVRPPPPGRAMRACGQSVGPLAPLFSYMKGFVQEKIKEELFRGFTAATRRNLSRTNLELRHDRPAGEISLSEGEIVAIVITNTPLIGGDSSTSASSSAPSHLQTLVHLL